MSSTVVGLISDTHGLVRREALVALQGVSLIVHAGDVGSLEVLEALGSVARVVAVRGNMDRGDWAGHLQATEVVEVSGARLYAIHDLAQLDVDPAAAGFAVVVSGHSHRPKVQDTNGVLYVNPGSAGPRRFDYPVSLMRLEVSDGRLDAELVHLEHNDE